MKLKWISASFLVALISACSSNNQSDYIKFDYTKEKVYLNNNKLIYLGEITEKRNYDLFKISEGISVSSIYISSIGGSIDSGIELARWIKKKDIDVYIGDLCASSCANYIIAAGKNVYLKENSILLWHGSSYQKDVSKAIESGNETAVKWRALEQDFFAEVDISPLVTVCGFNDFSIIDSMLHKLNIVPVIGFNYSLETLEKFGFKNLVPPEGGWIREKEMFGKKIIQAEGCDSVSWDF